MKSVLKVLAILTCAVSASLCAALEAPAQEYPPSVTLDEALALFGRNSPELQLARSRYRAALGHIRQGRALSNPIISGTHETLGDHSESYLTLTQSVDFLWERSHRADRARALRIRAQAAFLADSVHLAQEVKGAYLDVWARREILEAYLQAQEVMEDLVASAEARFSEGDLAGYDLRRLEMESLQLGRRAAVAELDLEDAQQRLGTFVSGSGELRPMSSQELGIPPRDARSLDIMVAQAFAARPELRAAQAMAQALDASASLVRSSPFRGTSLTGGWKRQTDGLDGMFVGVEVPLPMADRRQGALDAARAEAAAMESEIDLLRRVITRQVSMASARLETARRQQELLGSRGEADARQLLEIARLSFDEGEMRAVDLLDATKAFIDARLLQGQIRRDLWTAHFELEQALGGYENETTETIEGEDER